MPERPEKEVLLDAVGRFLDEVRPLIADPRLAFRVLIAQSLTGIVAGEIRAEAEHDAAAYARLAALFPDRSGDVSSSEARRLAIRDMTVVLAAELRAGGIGEERTKAIHDHLRQSLGEKLAVSNPRFDLRPAIE